MARYVSEHVFRGIEVFLGDDGSLWVEAERERRVAIEQQRYVDGILDDQELSDALDYALSWTPDPDDSGPIGTEAEWR